MICLLATLAEARKPAPAPAPAPGPAPAPAPGWGPALPGGELGAVLDGSGAIVATGCLPAPTHDDGSGEDRSPLMLTAECRDRLAGIDLRGYFVLAARRTGATGPELLRRPALEAMVGAQTVPDDQARVATALTTLELKKCFVPLFEGSGLPDRVVVHLRVEGDRVVKADAAPPYAGTELETCLRAAFTATPVPAVSAPVELDYPFVLR